MFFDILSKFYYFLKLCSSIKSFVYKKKSYDLKSTSLKLNMLNNF